MRVRRLAGSAGRGEADGSGRDDHVAPHPGAADELAPGTHHRTVAEERAAQDRAGAQPGAHTKDGIDHDRVALHHSPLADHAPRHDGTRLYDRAGADRGAAIDRRRRRDLGAAALAAALAAPPPTASLDFDGLARVGDVLAAALDRPA